MPRTIWKGAVSFGLVHVPVGLYPASSRSGISFDLLDRRSMDRIGYKRINKATGEEVASSDIVKGYEYADGHYAVLGDEEIRGANPASTQTVDILCFVDAREVPFLYLETPYFLAPDKRGDKVYALLREALKRAGKIGIANVVLHTKQHLAALMPMGPVLVLNTLRWGHDVRDYRELRLPEDGEHAAGVTERELAMATKLVDDMTERWDPTRYRDTFQDDILALVERKVASGNTEVVAAPPPPGVEPPKGADVIDMTELLKRSLEGRGREEQRPATASETGAKRARKGLAKARPERAARAKKEKAESAPSRRKRAGSE